MIYKDFLDEDELARYAKALNARAKTLKRAGQLNTEQLRHCILESGGHCQWCGHNLVGQPFELDHILNLSLRGQNTPDNLVVACLACNRRKGDKHPATFAQELAAKQRTITPLVQRILAQYQVEGRIQRSLFSAENDNSSQPPDDETPQYRW